MSIDIRRSTELMLKAKDAESFASFLAAFSKRIGEIVLLNHGVFDKFTGDGVLAYFPTFFTGNDAGLWAIRAAEECHLFFQHHYVESRTCFTAVPCEVGLGIGIDFGKVALLKILNDRTIIGKPVVYACRMGAAPAGETLLNVPAHLQLSPRIKDMCVFEETRVEVKHEGGLLAMSVHLIDKTAEPFPPEWKKEDLSQSKP